MNKKKINKRSEEITVEMMLELGLTHYQGDGLEENHEFPSKLYPYSKMFFTSFVIQQLYYYRYDKENLLSYSNLCRNASIVDWYDSLQRTAIVHLNHASSEAVKDLVCRLQPNVILCPGTFSSVLSALGWNNDNENLRLMTSSTLVQGTASSHSSNV